MRVFNENKTEELKEYDLEKGYLKADKLFVKYHEVVTEVKEQGHYKTIAEYPNGGKDIEWVVDVPAVQAKAAYDEYEKINVYIPYTEKQLAEREIAQIKAKLNAWDYKTSKYVDGEYTEEEWAEIKAQRKVWRDRINELEGGLL